MEIMRCTVRRQQLDVDVPTLVALTYDYINVKATFSSEWAGMQKWIHIRNVEDQSIIAHVLFNNDEIGEDVGLNLSAGEWDVWIHGALYEDNTLIKRITTNVKKIKVEATGSQDEILPSIGPSVAEQAVAAAERAEAAADEAEASASEAEGYSTSAEDSATRAQLSAANANTSANEAANRAFNAAQAATSAQNYANLAAEAVSHYPKIENDYWYVWDAANETWGNTNVLAKGATFTPSVDSYGNLSWTNNAGLPNPPSVNLVSLFDSVPELQARMDEILAEAEQGIADIEEQRDTILASIAAAAELGTDTTLTVSGMAADAKVTGENIKTILNTIYNNTSYMNEITIGSGVNPANGATLNGAKLARTSPPLRVIGGNYILVFPSAYEACVWAYSGTSASSATESLTGGGYADWPVSIVPTATNKRFRCGYRRKDGADMTSEDQTILQAGCKLLDVTDNIYNPKGLLADSDLNDLTAACTYLLGDGRSYLNSPIPSTLNGVIMNIPTPGYNFTYQVVFQYNNVYVRRYLNGAWSAWRLASGNSYVLDSTGDTTDRTSAINTMLTNNKVCSLGPGVFYAGNIVMPAGSTLKGSGCGSTKIIMNSSATGGCIAVGDGCEVCELSVEGGEVAIPSEAGTRNGVVVEGTYDGQTGDFPIAVQLHNLVIQGFNGSAILARNTSKKYYSGIIASDIKVRYSYYGINIAQWCEYGKWTDIDATDCYYGCVNNGGNNKFTNSGFDGNTIGALMDTTGITSPNNSHGGFCNCSFNHNTQLAVHIVGMVNGHIFSACQFFYGGITVEDSTSIRFGVCNFGRQTPINVSNSINVLFSDCSFYSATASAFTGSGNTNVKCVECYDRLGASVTF